MDAGQPLEPASSSNETDALPDRVAGIRGGVGAQIGGVTVTHLRRLKPGVLTAAALLIVLTWAQTVPPSAEAILQDTDGDGASDIGEELAGSDPNDPDSFPESTAAQFLSRLPLCNDGIDNDGDGLIDDDDPHCTDSDADIISDPTEQLLGSDPNDVASFPEDARLDATLQFHGGYAFCGDGIDNDGDGLTDGEDPGCGTLRSDADGLDDATEKMFGSDPANPESVPEHEAPNPGSCSDGVDNDLDGLTAVAAGVIGTGAGSRFGTPHDRASAGAVELNLLVTSENSIFEYTAAGELVREIPVPYGDKDRPLTERLRDVTIDQTGHIVAYNGTFDPYLSTYDVSQDSWSHVKYEGWSTANNGTYGGIASFQQYVFATDMDTSGAEPLGFIRFNTSDGSIQRFGWHGFIDLTIGQDGLLYGLYPGGSPAGTKIDVFEPIGMSFVRTIELGAEVRGIAVNSAGMSPPMTESANW